MIPFSDENGPRAHDKDHGQMRKWKMNVGHVWAADIRFTLDQIKQVNIAPEQKKAPSQDGST